MPPRHDFPPAPSVIAKRETIPLVRLQNIACPLLACLWVRIESGTSCVLEHLSNSLASSGRALEVPLGADLLSNGLTILMSHWPLVRPPQFLDHPWIASKILLTGNQDYRKAGAKVHNLRNPLLLNVIQRVGRVNGKTDQDDMRVGVTERTETVIVLLSGCIPQGKLNMLPINFNVGDIVLEHSRNINLRESSFREDDQQASLSTGTVTNNDQFPTEFGHDIWIESGDIFRVFAGRRWR